MMYSSEGVDHLLQCCLMSLNFGQVELLLVYGGHCSISGGAHHREVRGRDRHGGRYYLEPLWWEAVATMTFLEKKNPTGGSSVLFPSALRHPADDF